MMECQGCAELVRTRVRRARRASPPGVQTLIDWGVRRGYGPCVDRLRGVRSAVAAAVLAVAGCSSAPQGAGQPGGAGDGPVTIVWWSGPTTWGTDNDARQVLRDAFERANPSIRVQIVTGPDGTDRQRATLISDLSTEAASPDVYSGDVVWPYEFAHDGFAARLDKYLPASFWSTFAPPGTPLSRNTVVQNVSYDGGIYAVPYFIDKGLLYYRKDLLAEARLPVPTTWEQLIQDAQTLKADGLPYQYAWQGNDYEGLTCDWMEVLADALGGVPVGGDIAAELASPAAVKALDLLRTLINDGVSPSDSNALEESDGDALFDGGKAAFLRDWDSSYANAMSATSAVANPADVGVAPLPDFQGRQGPGWSALGGWNLFVNPHTANLKADLTFVTWIAGPQAQRILATQFSQIPSNYSVAADPSVLAASPVLTAAVRTRLVTRPAATLDYQHVSAAIRDNVHAALPGPATRGEDPCQALTAAAREIDPAAPALRCGAAANPGSGG